MEPGKQGGATRQQCLSNTHIEFLIGVLEDCLAATLVELQQELNDNFNNARDVLLMTITRALEDWAHMTLKQLHIDHECNNNADTIQQ